MERGATFLPRFQRISSPDQARFEFGIWKGPVDGQSSRHAIQNEDGGHDYEQSRCHRGIDGQASTCDDGVCRSSSREAPLPSITAEAGQRSPGLYSTIQGRCCARYYHYPYQHWPIAPKDREARQGGRGLQAGFKLACRKMW